VSVSGPGWLREVVWRVGFVFVPYSARGHVAPMLRVVAELTARGERVRVVADACYRDAVRAAGAVMVLPEVECEARVPAGYTLRELLERTRLRQRRWAAGRAVAHAFERVVPVGSPDVCVIDPHFRKLDAVACRSGRSVVRFWTTYAKPAWPMTALTLVNALPEFQPRHFRIDSELYFVGPLVDGMSPSDDCGIEWQGLVGPVLVVSPGTVFARSAEFFRGVVRAFAGSEWTVVIATGQLPVDAVGPVPDNIVVRQWIPQSQVLGYADVFLTHAGMNSIHESIVAGVPMLLAPRSLEQRFNASRAEILGLGARLAGPARLRRQVDWLAADVATGARLDAVRRRISVSAGPVCAADRLCGIAVRKNIRR